MIYPTRLLFWTDALTVNTNLILIRPEFIKNKPLIAHEMVHQRQMLHLGVWTFWFRYLTSKDFRLNVELEAYRVQVKEGASLDRAAQNLTKYWLSITNTEAKNLLEKQ